MTSTQPTRLRHNAEPAERCRLLPVVMPPFVLKVMPVHINNAITHPGDALDSQVPLRQWHEANVWHSCLIHSPQLNVQSACDPELNVFDRDLSFENTNQLSDAIRQ